MYLRIFAAGSLAFAALAAHANAQADGLKNFTDRLIAASAAILQSGNPAQSCRAALVSFYDVPGIARDIAADAWNKASAPERAAYQSAFEQAAVSSCAKFSANERGALLTFAGTRTADNGDQLAAVRVEAPGRGERTWIWRIRVSGGAFRVTDVIVDGASMLATERREISQAIAGEGSLAAATEYLRKRTAR